MPLVFVVGPPAVGKMTVGHALARLTALRLFHNHVTSDGVTRFFDYGTPAYGRLVTEFRTRIFEEVAASALPGLIFTYMWAFGEPGDAAFVRRLAETFRVRGRPVYLVELDPRPDWLDGYLRLDNAALPHAEPAESRLAP